MYRSLSCDGDRVSSTASALKSRTRNERLAFRPPARAVQDGTYGACQVAEILADRSSRQTVDSTSAGRETEQEEVAGGRRSRGSRRRATARDFAVSSRVRIGALCPRSVLGLCGRLLRGRLCSTFRSYIRAQYESRAFSAHPECETEPRQSTSPSAPQRQLAPIILAESLVISLTGSQIQRASEIRLRPRAEHNSPVVQHCHRQRNIFPPTYTSAHA